MLRGDRVALEDMSQAMLDGLIRSDPSREILRLATGTGNHLRSARFSKIQSPKLLLRTCSSLAPFQFFWAGLR